MIYLDYAATTPCDPEVVEAMLPFFTEKFANASSIDHLPGSEARRAVEHAREHVARLVDANPEDVIFTSGSTEANNLVLSIEGLVVTSAVEHPSILEPARSRAIEHVHVLPVNAFGVVDRNALRDTALGPASALLSIMHTNNETGAQNDISSLSSFAREHGLFFHTDLTQGVLSSDISLRELPIDAVSLSAHKIYGPKGVGALICRPALRRKLKGITLGGGHERGLRSGTLNVPGIVGFGAAARLAHARKDEWRRHVRSHANSMLNRLSLEFSGEVKNNAGHQAQSHILSLQLKGANNRAVVRATADCLAFALGSACATTKNEPSYVLREMGLSVEECNYTIRLSFGFGTSDTEVAEAASLIATTATRLLEMVA